MTTEQATKLIWDYHLLGHDLVCADIIWALGSHDLRVAERAAELWHDGLAPWVVMSGGLGNFTEGVFHEAEADLFAKRAVELGVPSESILIENKSTNTGENVSFTRDLLGSKYIEVTSAIAVQKPYMERRTFATVLAQWPGLDVQVTSPQLKLDAYCTTDIPRDHVISIMVGDLQRIMEYPKQGFMIEQDLPPIVTDAMHILIEAGYDTHLLR